MTMISLIPVPAEKRFCPEKRRGSSWSMPGALPAQSTIKSRISVCSAHSTTATTVRPWPSRMIRHDGTVGTEITLSLNTIDIDYGKNEHWKSHYWLFPPDSIRDIEYLYAGGVTRTKPAFQTSLGEARYRLCHLGYSAEEARSKFEVSVSRWNRTANLALSYEDFRDTLVRVDFATLTPADLEPFVWDFRRFIVHLLGDWDTEGALLEDFIFQLDFALTLRVLADRSQSDQLPLVWHYQDLVDSGWASFDDLTDIDRKTYIVNHTVLLGRLQDHSGCFGLDQFDCWLVAHGKIAAHPYAHAQAIIGWRKDIDCLIHAPHPDGANCDGIHYVEDDSVYGERVRAQKATFVKHPAFPLGVVSLTGLALAVFVSLYGAPRAREVFGEIRGIKTADGQLREDFVRLSVLD
jgi:hypothetical protein